MEIVFENPGLCHIGEKIFKNMDIQSKFTCRLVRKSLNGMFEKQASRIDLQKVPNWNEFLKKRDWRKFLQESKTKIPTLVLNSYLQNLFFRVTNSTEELNYITPLFAFAITGNSKLVEIILHMNTITSSYSEKLDALNSAAKYGHVNVAKGLKAYRNYIAVHSASEHGHLEVLKVLIDDVTTAGDKLYAYVNLQTIEAAACSGKVEVIKYFQEKLPEYWFRLLLTQKDVTYGTIIHNIAAKGRVEMLRYFCQTSFDGYSINPMLKNSLGRTPIHYAAEEGHLEIVEFLAFYTSNPNATADKSGWTPSEYARSKGFLDIEAYLLNPYFDLIDLRFSVSPDGGL